MATPFVYNLPEERIAQRPAHPYDSAKLLLVKREDSGISEGVFSKIWSLFHPGDLILFNNTRVIPARFIGKIRERGTEAELFLVEKITDEKWRCIGKPMRRFLPGTILEFSDGLCARILGEGRAGESGQSVVAEFFSEASARPADSLADIMQRVGCMPIPPYIRKGRSDEADKQDYQTCFARIDGSVAAPTASLHFTPELLQRIKDVGCDIRHVTLHVGAASIKPLFRPEQGETAEKLKSPAGERFRFDPEIVAAVKSVKAGGGRVIAVGTTVVRAVETMMLLSETGSAAQLETELFIRPGFNFKAVDVLVTNFHQPATTHLLLVEAFMKDRGLLEESYSYALNNNFRFLSYGDGMVVL